MTALSKIIEEAKRVFGKDEPFWVSRAPGRVNLIGEHTDYNKGLALPGAIDKSMYFAFKPNSSANINAYALDLNQTYTLDLNRLIKTNKLWVDYLTGLLLEFKNCDISITGFDCILSSDIPIGSGMSSSAAFDCAVILGLNHLYNCNFSKWDMVNISHASNNNFLCIKSGILDQFSSLFGKKNKVMFLNCDTLDYTYIDLPKSDFCWLLIDTCVKHNHQTSAYNTRVLECQSALKSIQESLPHINHLSAINEVEEISCVLFNTEIEKSRATYIIEENKRVKSFIEALKHDDPVKCGQLMYDSHLGLSNQYEVSCSELDFLVEQTMTNADVLGARMMGGGFGGCTLNLLKRESIPGLKEEISEKYKNSFDRYPEFHQIEIGNDTEIMHL